MAGADSLSAATKNKTQNFGTEPFCLCTGFQIKRHRRRQMPDGHNKKCNPELRSLRCKVPIKELLEHAYFFTQDCFEQAAKREKAITLFEPFLQNHKIILHFRFICNRSSKRGNQKAYIIRTRSQSGQIQVGPLLSPQRFSSKQLGHIINPQGQLQQNSCFLRQQ